MNSNTGSAASESGGKSETVLKVGDTPLAQSDQQMHKPQKIGLVGVIVSIFIIGAIAHFAGWDENPQTLVREIHGGVTKAQWRQKALPFYNPGGGIKLTTVSNFKKVMGEPSSTQTIEGHSFWYFDCADGTIQVVLIDPALSGGTLAIDSINDY
jgi:hypothetical protein